MMNDATYDHDRTVTAFFDTRAAAEKAMADVVAAGVPSSMVSIVAGHSVTTAGTTGTTTSGVQDEGFWGSVKNLFAPEEDKHAYAEGLSRGGYLLSARVTEAHYDRVLGILDHEGAVDMYERETQWRSDVKRRELVTPWSLPFRGKSVTYNVTPAPIGIRTPSRDTPRPSAEHGQTNHPGSHMTRTIKSRDQTSR